MFETKDDLRCPNPEPEHVTSKSRMNLRSDAALRIVQARPLTRRRTLKAR